MVDTTKVALDSLSVFGLIPEENLLEGIAHLNEILHKLISKSVIDSVEGDPQSLSNMLIVLVQLVGDYEVRLSFLLDQEEEGL